MILCGYISFSNELGFWGGGNRFLDGGGEKSGRFMVLFLLFLSFLFSFIYCMRFDFFFLSVFVYVCVLLEVGARFLSCCDSTTS